MTEPCPTDEDTTTVLVLYVSGETINGRRAIANLREICEQELRGAFKLEVVDTRKEPHRAMEANILATPTLIKSLPPPVRRLIGDLSDREKVLQGLDIVPP